MHALIDRHLSEIAALCRRYGVRWPEVFGSAARGIDFDPATSDADFLVEFDPESNLPPLQQFFGLAEALESLLDRPVDLVETGAIRNPFIPGRDRACASDRLCRVTSESTCGMYRTPQPRSRISLLDWISRPTDQPVLSMPQPVASSSWPGLSGPSVAAHVLE